MMALHVGLRRRPAPAAIVGYSGLLVLEDGQGPESLRPMAGSAPPILLVHGDRDDVVPVEMFLFSKAALGAAEIPCHWHLSAGLGHGIDEEGLRQGGLFLAQAFGLPSPAGS
jgi:phospholipase/carboxylesterase